MGGIENGIDDYRLATFRHSPRVNSQWVDYPCAESQLSIEFLS
jgi:hypothetical protein